MSDNKYYVNCNWSARQLCGVAYLLPTEGSAGFNSADPVWRGTFFKCGIVPPRDANLRALSRSIRALRASRTNAVFSADRKSTRLNSSHQIISYAVFCLKKKKKYY